MNTPDDHEPSDSAMHPALALAMAERQAEQVLVNADPVPGAPVEYLAAFLADAITEHRKIRADLRAARQAALDGDDDGRRERVRELTELRGDAVDSITGAAQELLDHIYSPPTPTEETR